MSDLNDENIRRVVRAGADQIDTLLSHFHADPEASFASFDKIPSYLVRLYLTLDALSVCIQTALQEQTHVHTDTAA